MYSGLPMGLSLQPNTLFSFVPKKIACWLLPKERGLHVSDEKRTQRDLWCPPEISKRNEVICKRQQEWFIHGPNAKYRGTCVPD